jgi:molecular chaperone DnaJ
MTAATADWLTTDFYAVLGVPPTATDKQITRAYRKLARELHPDTRTGGGNDDRFKEVAAAYAVLGDEAKRKEYDDLRAAAAQRPSGWAADRGGFRVRVPSQGQDDVDGFYDGDLFGGMSVEDLLSGRFTSAGFDDGGAPPRRPRRGRDLQTSVRLSFEQAVRGATVDIPLDYDRTVSARIPAGVEDGQTVRLPGRGDPGSAGGPAGDLLVQVSVDRHPLLGRDGRDLTVAVPVTFPEAALGADVPIPTLDGPVTLRIPPGTASGTTLRVRGRGVPAAGGNTRHSKAGDLLVTVQVDVPKQLTDEQRAAIEQLAAATTQSPRRHLGVPR